MSGTMPQTRPPAGTWRDVDGIVLLDKPEGLTSNAALQRVRRAFRARKAGHTGSLDPLASGLLPVCLGQATKASGLLLDADKTYRVRIAFGKRTTTGDREGEVAETAPVPELRDEAVRRVTASFLGQSTQVPPMYSALKHHGERLYRLARQGIEVERPPRRVIIHRLDVLQIGPEWLDLEVVCSKGTYVRSLAEDIARACGTVGHVASLRRLALGPFGNPAMRTLETIEQAAPRPEELDSMLLPADEALPGLPAIRLGAAEEASILHGQPVATTGPAAARVRMYGVDGRFLGVGRMSAEGRRLAPERIMIDLSGGQAPRA
ncbi:MAG: tRNA pseudouridine(55) synthase TruB [Steroidobacteraceae bacterium]